MLQRGQQLTMSCDMQVQFYDGDPMSYNVIAEIPGTDLKDEIVMVGAHLDSWHSGTGATDNGAGSACAMEAVRIIQSLGLKPRRTIRVALWTGEEQGLLGSAAYVKQHLGSDPDAAARREAIRRAFQEAAEAGDPTTQPATPPAPVARNIKKEAEYDKLSVYFNLDNGTGKIRGVYAQGNRQAVPLFSEWLKPFADLGANTVTLSNTGSTDHVSFDGIGLPGFQFIQDQIEYNSRTHHSNQDNYDRLQAPDMKQASTIMATFVWNAANMDERFPRKPLVDEPRGR
jgi:Zn-dependent M28 family amino/carboxypeptidase